MGVGGVIVTSCHLSGEGMEYDELPVTQLHMTCLDWCGEIQKWKGIVLGSRCFRNKYTGLSLSNDQILKISLICQGTLPKL